jgi:hypothetical protein
MTREHASLRAVATKERGGQMFVTGDGSPDRTLTHRGYMRSSSCAATIEEAVIAGAWRRADQS